MIKHIDVSFHYQARFERGKIYCVEAASGVGKSSLLHFIGGLRTPSQGTVLLDGRNILDFTPDEKSQLYRTELAYLFQDLKLFPNLTAFENVQIVNQITHFRDKNYILSLFQQLGISDKVDKPVQYLSLGEQQRVAFIRALCQPSSFLLLDEPISHLDDCNAQIMAHILENQLAERQVGIIITSLGKDLPIHYDQILKL